MTASEQPILLSRKLDRICFTLERCAPQKHETMLAVQGLPPGAYAAVDGTTTHSFRAETGRTMRIPLIIDTGGTVTVRLEPSMQ
jgi:hypothetical protein